MKPPSRSDLASLTTSSGWQLRPWTLDDIAELPRALSAEEAERQLGRRIAFATDAADWFADRQRDWAAGTSYSWAVKSASGAVVGSVTVSSVDRGHDTGWLSYWTATTARGRGVAGEATSEVARWAFTCLGLFRLELGHRTDNPQSWAVARKAGFLVEGLERAKLRYGTERFDVESTPARPPTQLETLSPGHSWPFTDRA